MSSKTIIYYEEMKQFTAPVPLRTLTLKVESDKGLPFL